MNYRMVALTVSAVLSVSVLHGLEFKIERDISYRSAESLSEEGDYARNRCKLDLRFPVGVTNFATVVYFHGGGIVWGKKGGFLWPEEAMDHDPVALVSGGYRLLTNATPEQSISDAAAAVAWTLRNISRYGGDPKKVFVTGISAGGYLTAMVGLDCRWLAKYGFKPADLAGIIPLTGQMTKHFNVRKIGFKDTDPQFMPKVDEWAPLYHVSTNPLPPCCFLTGGRDIEWKARVEENALLAASLRACGHKNVEFHETEGNHGGGTYPSRYLLRDFVMKNCNAGGIPGFVDGECIVVTGGKALASSVVPCLQLFCSTRYPGSNVKVLAAMPEDFGRGEGRWGFKPDRVLVFSDGADIPSDPKVWVALGAKQLLRLTSSPKGMDDVMFSSEQYVKGSKGASSKVKGLLTAMQLVDAMHINPIVARVAVDAKRGIAFAASSPAHKDAKGRKLPDCLNVKVSRIEVRKDGIAFTYAPKALPFPVISGYAASERLHPLTERFNQEIFMVEKLCPGTYELAFDGVKVGEFTAKEFETGVNVALLDTPNQRKSAALVKLAESLCEKYAAWRKERKPSIKAELEDAYEMLNTVRPSISRVTLKSIDKLSSFQLPE